MAISGDLASVAVITTARSSVLALTETLWAARPARELIDTVTAIEELKSSLEAIELDLVHELAETNGATADGWSNARDFVTTVTGGHKGAGSATLRLAKAIHRDCAPVGEAMRDGWLSRAKGDAIAHTIEQLPSRTGLRAEAVQLMLDLAKTLDATDLRKAGRHLITVIDPDGDERKAERELDREERAAHRGRFLAVTDDGAGGVRIKGRAAIEDGARLKAALMSLSGPQPQTQPSCDGAGGCATDGCAHDGKDPRDHGARMLDALLELVQRAESADVLPDGHGATPRLTLTMDLEHLRQLTGSATTLTGESLSAAAVRRLACDTDVIPIVLGSNSEVLDVGRTQRLVTAAIWKALVTRDKHCRFPGCTRAPIACDAHHIRHWINGGPTSLANLVLLCRAHHTAVHNGPWLIRVRPGGEISFELPLGVHRRVPSQRQPPDT